MTTRKRTDWLDIGDEEEEPYDSEAVEESRTQAVASRSKRRKVNDSNDSDSEAEAEEPDDVPRDANTENNILQRAQVISQSDQINGNADEEHLEASRTGKSKLAKKLAKKHNASSRTGVIYISRVPPFMKPQALRRLLEPYASSGLNRIFLTPEDTEQRTARVRGGGNKKRSFTDGWVEFVSKTEAKAAVEHLNTRTIGGKKGSYYRDDVWNLKYLTGFKWHHLTEQIANENAERAARMRAESERGKREVREFLNNVEKSKIEDTREKKRKKKAEKETGASGDARDALADANGQRSNGHFFRQNQPIRPRKPDKTAELPGNVTDVLSKIF
jgi:ESF2/ABP1 family protein